MIKGYLGEKTTAKKKAAREAALAISDALESAASEIANDGEMTETEREEVLRFLNQYEARIQKLIGAK